MSVENMNLRDGTPDNLGAVYDGRGVNFAIFSANATKIELCLFDKDGNKELRRVPLPKRSGDIWHGYIPDMKPGQVYGYRVHGPYNPTEGHFFNPNKLLLDPYARETVGEIKWTDDHFDFNRDSAPSMIKAKVPENYDPASSALATAWSETIVYEAHMRGLTELDDDIPQDERGTAEAVSNKHTVEKLKKLGITSIEFLPVHSKIDDKRLENLHLKNYWGYNNISFFAIEKSYLKTGKRQEFRDMIKKLKKEGIEVIIDVVYNHTAEGGPDAPILSFRGIDNASYYKLNPNDKSRYVDQSGCGNSLNLNHPQVRKLVKDSLKLLVEDGVAGFRFDEATVLGRMPDGKFSANHEFFKEMKEDPILSKVKLVGEAWDCSPESYQLGNFPAPWKEWNGEFRDNVRAFWRGDYYMLGAFASSLTATSRLFDKEGRTPQASVNFLACHDGFTLHDVVSYSHKYNEANLEGNRDGHNGNYSYNYGEEGVTANQEIRLLREKQKRNMIATLFLSHGTPMLLAGDEFGNSQQGNNNAYCQDSEIGWVKPNPNAEDAVALEAFTQRMIEFRKDNPIFKTENFLHGDKTDADGVANLQWIAPSGGLMQECDWNYGCGKCLGMMLNNGAVEGGREKGRMLAIFNAAANPVPFTLPVLAQNAEWEMVIDTNAPEMVKPVAGFKETYTMPERSVAVFVQKPKL